jgi:hypothetical protein
MVSTSRYTRDMKRTTITYSKQFMTGNLKGISVRCSYNVDADRAHTTCLDLQAITKQNPGSDTMTNAKFWVYNVGTEEVAQ